MPRKDSQFKPGNRWGSERLGCKQRKLLRLMIDHGGRWAWTANDHLRYTERQTMLSLEKKGYVQRGVQISRPGGDPTVQVWFWEIVPQKISTLENDFGMKA